MAASCGAAAVLAQTGTVTPSLGFSSSVNVQKSAGFSGLRLITPFRRCVKNAARVFVENGRKCGVAVAAVAVPVVTFDGASAGEAVINLKSARPETAGAVVHRGVITELQNRRRGGGVVFGPKPVDWRIKINKKEKQLAISTALQSAAVDSLVVDDLESGLTTPKTKEFLAAMKRWGVNPAQHSVIFTTEVSKELELSSRNVKTVKLLTPRTLNLYDILRADKVLFTKAGLEYLNSTYCAETYEELEEGEVIDTQASEASE
ncbi:hypothetical protein R1flu_021307 [Riccia fluitans]|uniref:Large ribosomal subunit protein uL4c n=1 Tax=Riccia fluitans TaxID=41844 RepID=A0ABD1ZSG1_9MARC